MSQYPNPSPPGQYPPHYPAPNTQMQPPQPPQYQQQMQMQMPQQHQMQYPPANNGNPVMRTSASQLIPQPPMPNFSQQPHNQTTQFSQQPMAPPMINMQVAQQQQHNNNINQFRPPPIPAPMSSGIGNSMPPPPNSSSVSGGGSASVVSGGSGFADEDGQPAPLAQPAAQHRRRLYPEQQMVGAYQQPSPPVPQPPVGAVSAGYPQPSVVSGQTYPPPPHPPQQPMMMQAAVSQLSQQMAGLSTLTGQSHLAGIPIPAAATPQLLEQFQCSTIPSRTIAPTATSYPVVLAPPSLQRSTLNIVPQTSGLLTKSRLPFGLLLHPFKHLSADAGEVIPVIGATQRQDPQQPVYSAESIVRCRRCRTYINPFVQFVDQMNWRCSVCFMLNEVPQFFDYDSATQQYQDRYARPELTHCAVEYVAPDEYMVRPPQAPAFVFIIDVSFAAITSGMLATFSRTLAECLDSIANDERRTRVAFITVDTLVHFYNLELDSGEPEMLVVSDVEDIFLPVPDGLLVSLTDCRQAIDSLLQKLPELFPAQSAQPTGNALGAAMQAAFKMISANGGKIVCFQSALPSIEPGSLKPREDPKSLGTAAESALLQPASSFYKSLAVDCSRSQVTVDAFLFGGQYMDLASLTVAPRYTAGSLYYYPGFNAVRPEDAFKFASELNHFLSRPMGLEAVLRVRCTKGIRPDAFHGNFFVRSSDLLALPSVSPDNSYAFQMTLEENLPAGMAVCQTALLYTTHFGERRIRVITTAYPVSQDLTEIFRNVDSMAMVNLLSKMAIERGLNSKLEDAREAVVNKCVDILGCFKQTVSSSASMPQLIGSENLLSLPLALLATVKHRSLRPGSQVPSDFRTAAMSLLRVLPTELLSMYLHPNLYELHNMPAECGMPAQQSPPNADASVTDGRIVMPTPVNLCSERIVRHGIYLLDTLDCLYLWVGRAVPPQIIHDLFDRPALEALMPGKTTLPRLDNTFNRRVQAIIGKLREDRRRSFLYPDLVVVKEEGGDPLLRLIFLSHMIEDRQDIGVSYPQFLNEIRERIQKGGF